MLKYLIGVGNVKATGMLYWVSVFSPLHGGLQVSTGTLSLTNITATIQVEAMCGSESEQKLVINNSSHGL